MHARAIAQISYSALSHNLRGLARRAGVPLLLPIKANAYGHGLELVARWATQQPEVWGLAVAMPREAAQVAALGLGKPVVLLGVPTPDEVPELVELGVRIPVTSLAEVAALPSQARVHLKVNTGMNRLGVRPAEAVVLGQKLAERGQLEGVYTHLASADEPDLSSARAQLETFREVLRQLPPVLAHAANGGGVLSFGPLEGMALARPGLAAYGIAPPHLRGVVDLTPVMTLQAKVTQLQEVHAGESVSYGGLWTASGPTQVAVLGIGYGDGYPRSASLKASVLIAGERRPVLGRVCMDQLMVDVTGLGVQVGDWATLWGAGELTVSEVSEWSGLIEYELLTGVSERVDRVEAR